MQAYAKNVTDSRFTQDGSTTYSFVGTDCPGGSPQSCDSRRLGAGSFSAAALGITRSESPYLKRLGCSLKGCPNCAGRFLNESRSS